MPHAPGAGGSAAGEGYGPYRTGLHTLEMEEARALIRELREAARALS